jgi:hypothetical protein
MRLMEIAASWRAVCDDLPTMRVVTEDALTSGELGVGA